MSTINETKVNLDDIKTSCMYNTQGILVCNEFGDQKTTEFKSKESCTNGSCKELKNFQCNDMKKCGNKNDILFARFQGESSTWR
jgi:hypothetical protein